ncbi:MAG: DUF5688 family protein [Lachnospiraceae bacterium]|nr:DUF5688 family protein [Lachnospiraceae bacterium]
MKYEEFVVGVKECIKRKKGEEVRIYINHIRQNNGGNSDSICLLSAGENVTPAIGLEQFYQMACQGFSIEAVCDEILRYYQHYQQEKELDTSFFTEYSRSRERIVCRLIHHQKNQELLSEIPHIPFLDLAVVYYYLMDEDAFCDGAILVQNPHLDMWGITQSELHDQALKNTVRLLPCEFISMQDLLCQLTGLRIFDEETEHFPMYVLTNEKKSFGAVYILYGDILETVFEKIGEDFYILPGSVHECILVPVSVDMDETDLCHLVREVNENQVIPEERLSDSVYRYYHSGKCLCIASAGV